MKRVQVVAVRVAVLAGLLVAGVGVSAALADPGNGNGPPSSPPGQGECQHGNSGQECKPDPQPEHGKECDDHGNQGGVDEDHCLGTTDSTTTTESTPTNQTTSPSGSTTTDETTTTDHDHDSSTHHAARYDYVRYDDGYTKYDLRYRIRCLYASRCTASRTPDNSCEPDHGVAPPRGAFKADDQGGYECGLGGEGHAGRASIHRLPDLDRGSIRIAAVGGWSSDPQACSLIRRARPDATAERRSRRPDSNRGPLHYEGVPGLSLEADSA